MEDLNIEIIYLYDEKVIISYDKSVDRYTIASFEKGSVIICNKNRDLVINQWLEAMEFTNNIQKLIDYKKS